MPYDDLNDADRAKADEIAVKHGWTKEVAALLVTGGADADNPTVTAVRRSLLKQINTNPADQGQVASLAAEITETQNKINELRGERVDLRNAAAESIRLTNRLANLRQQLSVTQAASA